MTDRRAHWEQIYASRRPDAVSWFQAKAEPSLGLIGRTGAGPPSRLVDVGGGASPLAAGLVAQGWRAPTVLDIAEAALAAAREAAGPAAASVDWVAADVLDWRPAEPFDLWHDRAVFHFLTEADDRARYRATLAAALRPDGWLILAAFAPDGPEICSGLPVQRWSAAGLEAELGEGYALRHTLDETHTTPWGAGQKFTWTLFQRLA